MKSSRDMFRTALLATAIAAAPCAFAATGMKGQWIGSSHLEGDRDSAKTTLLIGAADAEDSSLVVEGGTTCTLRGGKYTAAGDDISLTFGKAQGSASCQRLAQGQFTVHAGSKPREITFEATYPGRDGKQDLRRGALHKYP